MHKAAGQNDGLGGGGGKEEKGGKRKTPPGITPTKTILARLWLWKTGFRAGQDPAFTTGVGRIQRPAVGRMTKRREAEKETKRRRGVRHMPRLFLVCAFFVVFAVRVGVDSYKSLSL
ncbi:uncharacterized protein SPSK_10924 [Sporothrix schenckii 1099-18]|uniref:Uncharacterized protein n=1 Tax=Sporothrix schenckii 1099-18 TaxID=1397361 RepID=A0A0F2M7C5_SPOSC|nr:uncharacterized protein SPSK_10924 [Sporothrix schenckii 1099-18]KJR85537.1 hypothetical protein SPSK_10924 [Sporothrix schenckii 1099-18]